MEIEHIILQGENQIFNTDILDSNILQSFMHLQHIEQTVTVIGCPVYGDYDIQITLEENYAVFVLEKESLPVTINYCCFKEDAKQTVLELIHNIARCFKIKSKHIALPSKPLFLYTIIKNQEVFNEISAHLNIERYIFFALNN